MRGFLGRARAKLIVLSAGGCLLQSGLPFQGCDQVVKDALFQGLSDGFSTIAVSVIDAFFISINEVDPEVATTV